MSSEKGWERVQVMAFTSWLNGILEKRSLHVDNIALDMDDGTKLINFLELVSAKKMKEKYAKNPPTRIQKIENLHLALTFLKKEIEVTTGGASAEDFADHNLKMILGFFWSLFRHFRIQTIKHEDKSSEEGLLAWVKQQTASYKDINVENYKHGFRSGLAFLALCDQYLEHNKEVLDYDQFAKDKPVDVLAKAFAVAEKELGVPKLLDAEEVHSGDVDERSLVLYISLYFHAYNAKQAQKGVLEEKSKIESQLKGLQGSLEDRAKYAAVLDEENKGLKAEIERMKSEIESLKGELESQKQATKEVEESKVQLEHQIEGLNGQIFSVTEGAKKEKEDFQNKGTVQLQGLAVLKKNLDEHVEDLHRWQKYLDFDKNSVIDFSGEIRPQILADIVDKNYDEQVKILAEKLAKENQELEQLLKSKEEEKKAQKAKEDEKKKKKTKDEN